MRINDLIPIKEKEVIFCQYRDKFCEIPKKEIFSIPGLSEAVPQVLHSYLSRVQVYETYAVRFDFKKLNYSNMPQFRPGSLVCTKISDETVSVLLSKIANAKAI